MRRDDRVDLASVPFAMAWHLSGVVAVISLLLHKWMTAAGAAAVFLLAAAVLHRTW